MYEGFGDAIFQHIFGISGIYFEKFYWVSWSMELESTIYLAWKYAEKSNFDPFVSFISAFWRILKSKKKYCNLLLLQIMEIHAWACWHGHITKKSHVLIIWLLYYIGIFIHHYYMNKIEYPFQSFVKQAIRMCKYSMLEWKLFVNDAMIELFYINRQPRKQASTEVVFCVL